jgi:hypothetical protein
MTKNGKRIKDACGEMQKLEVKVAINLTEFRNTKRSIPIKSLLQISLAMNCLLLRMATSCKALASPQFTQRVASSALQDTSWRDPVFGCALLMGNGLVHNLLV